MKSQSIESLDKNQKVVNQPSWVGGFLDINNSIFPDYSKQEFHISVEDIWWNQGNETKPNFAEFNQMQFEQLEPSTAATFHNELNGKMTLKKDQIKKLIKVVIPYPDDFANPLPPDPIVKYYYVSKILNYSGNALVNVELELDLWTTYLIHNENLELWTSRFNPEWNNNQSNLITKPFKTDLAKYNQINGFNVKFLKYKTANTQQIKFINSPKYTSNEARVTKHNLADICTYYVFETKNTTQIQYNRNHIVLIPVLFNKADADNVNALGENKVKKLSDIRSEDIFFASEQTYGVYGDNVKWDAHRLFLNSETNLDRLINEAKDPSNQLHGLGNFVGKFFGPNFFNLKHLNEKLVVEFKLEQTRFTHLDINDFVLWEYVKTTPIPGVQNSEYDLKGFSCFRLYPNEINLNTPTNLEWSEELKNALLHNARPFDNDQGLSTLFSESFIFSNGFLFVSHFGDFQVRSSLTVFEDSYFDWLKNSKINMDNQINVINQQMAFNLSKNFIESAISGSMNPSGIIGSVGSLIGQSIQFSNTRRTINSHQEQAFKTASNQLKTNDLLFTNSYHILKNDPVGFAIDIAPENKVGYVLFGTYQVAEANQFNYYGFDQGFTKIENQTFKTYTSGYLNWPSFFEGVAFLNEDFSPQIRKLLIELLKNGVRVATKAEVQRGFK